MPLSIRDRQQIFAELAKLTKAGFGIDRSVALLGEQARPGAQKRFAASLQAALRSGHSIAGAFEEPGASPLDHRIIEASENAGVLEQGFAYLADYYQSVLRTRQTIQGRLIYPAVLVHFAAFLPALPSIILGSEAGPAIRDALVGLAFIYAAALILYFTASTLVRLAVRHVAVDRWLAFVPLVGRLRQLIALERFCQVFRVALLSGLPPSEALAGAGEATQSARFRKAAGALAENARSGNPLAPRIHDFRVFPSDLARSLANSEAAGSLPADLQHWGENYRLTVSDKLEQLGVAFPRLVFFAVVIYVAWRILSVYSSMISGTLEQFESYW